MPDPKANTLGMRTAEFYRLAQVDVERELEQRFSQYIDNESLLETYTQWLVFQIPNMGHRSHEDSSETIRRGCGYLSSRNYNKGLVLAAFSRHKDLYLRAHPEGSRAFNLAKRDVEINYKVSPRLRSNPCPPSTHTTSRSSKTALKPAKPVLSQTQSTTTTPVTKSPKETQSALDDPRPRDQQRLFTRLEESVSQGPSSTKPTQKMHVPSSPDTQIPPANYVCKRCGIPGHFIKQCHTIGNPLFDRRPPKGYVCRVCGAARTHYVHECPRNVVGNIFGPIPDSGRSMSVSTITSTKDSGGRLVVPYGEDRAGPCQMSMDPSKAGALEYSMPLTTGGSGRTVDLGSAGETEPYSVGQALNSIGDYMNSGRAKYIYSHIENSQPEPKDCLTRIGSPSKSASNAKSAGPRRRPDSYRPNPYHPDSYRPVGSSRGDDSYRPDDLYRPAEIHRPDVSVHHDEPNRLQNPERQNGRLSPYHVGGLQKYEPSDCHDRLHRHESSGRLDEPRRRESSARPNGSRRATDSCYTDGSKRRGLANTREVIEKKATSRRETIVYSLPKRKRSDGRLSPWDDIHPPAKKPRQQDASAGGLPWDDIETPQKKGQGDSADSSTAKQVIVVNHETGPSFDSRRAVSGVGVGVAKQQEKATDAEWEQARTEANAFLEAFSRELAAFPKVEASAESRDEVISDSSIYSPTSSTGQHQPSEDSAPGGGEDVSMAEILDDIAESTRSMSCEVDEDQPRSDLIIVPFQTLKSPQRDHSHDSGILNLLRWRENSRVPINVTRRRKAVDMYTETEEACAAIRMSHLAV